MGRSSAIAAALCRALEAARRCERPFRHWHLEQMLPEDVCNDLRGLPVAVPRIGDTEGRRETHNASRTFFSPALCAEQPVCREVVEAFHDAGVMAALESLIGRNLRQGRLRIEYCQDRDGFWLEPHTDIRVKLLTLQLYLNEGTDGAGLGTDLYDADKQLRETAPAAFNSAMMFVPAEDTWHGFEKRPINGVRRSLIVNFVNADWRDTAQLAEPVPAVA